VNFNAVKGLDKETNSPESLSSLAALALDDMTFGLLFTIDVQSEINSTK
jgi:hypothetical protein